MQTRKRIFAWIKLPQGDTRWWPAELIDNKWYPTGDEQGWDATEITEIGPRLRAPKAGSAN